MSLVAIKPAARKPTKKKKERQPGEPMTKQHLLHAISIGKVSEVEEWFSSGDRDPNHPDPKGGNTLLERAMRCAWGQGHHSLGRGWAARKGGFQIARALIARGADLNSRMDADHRTVLYIAAAHGTAESINFLIDNGAELEATNALGSTPLMHACVWCVTRGCSDTLLALLKRGASLDVIDVYGEGVLDYLIGDGFYPMHDARYNDPYVFEDVKAVLAEIKDAGGWHSYAREPRRNLLALRLLCEQGRASPPEAFMPVELLVPRVLTSDTLEEAYSLARSAMCAPLPILKRLFAAAPPSPPELDEAQGKCYRLRDGAGPDEIPKEIFWHILTYWRTFTDDAVDLRSAVRLEHEAHEDRRRRAEIRDMQEDY